MSLYFFQLGRSIKANEEYGRGYFLSRGLVPESFKSLCAVVLMPCFVYRMASRPSCVFRYNVPSSVVPILNARLEVLAALQ